MDLNESRKRNVNNKFRRERKSCHHAQLGVSLPGGGGMGLYIMFYEILVRVCVWQAVERSIMPATA